jgi:site-specific recombinase XerD
MSDQCFDHETWLSKLRDHLDKERYAAATARWCIAVARHFLRCLDKQHVEIRAAQPTNVERYLQHAQQRYRRRHGHSPNYRGWQCLHTNGIHMLLRLVHSQWPPVAVPTTPIEVLQRELCGEYSRWITDFSGLAPHTVSYRCAEARRFLDWRGERATPEDLATLAVVDVDAYIKDRASSLGRRSIKLAATNIRSFLRWLHSAEHIPRDLSSSVIAPSLYALEGIPCAVRAEDVSKVLSVAQEDFTPKGIRDYAILMLLSKYGVRAGEITNLRLDDVDWRKEIIRIRHSKTGVISYLPLLPDVGEAILRYLQKSRPKTSLREIFIRNRAPYRPFKDGSSLYGLVRCRIEAAGVITRGRCGPHAFRHARAVSLLRGAVPVKEIGDLLGHRSADSTVVYLKLATEDLRAVAMEIPMGAKA